MNWDKVIKEVKDCKEICKRDKLEVVDILTSAKVEAELKEDNIQEGNEYRHTGTNQVYLVTTGGYEKYQLVNLISGWSYTPGGPVTDKKDIFNGDRHLFQKLR